jgi:regulator of protease activity HflC (stomatin/prohibitin superfamily)
MKKQLFLLAFVAILSLSFTSCGISKIDSGNEGIKVSLVGSDRGVNDINLVTGWVFYNPITTAVYEYPTFVQTIDYPAFTINAKDGSSFTVDPTVSLKVINGATPMIFKKYRKPLDEVLKTTLFNYTRDAFRIQMNSFTTDEIVSKRDTLERRVENALREALLNEGFQLEQLTSGLEYPQTIVDAVNAKNKAIQSAMQAENELRLAEAQARKLVVAAQAEREANELRMKALTPLLIQQQIIDKWDGKLPVYGQVPTLFRNITQ